MGAFAARWFVKRAKIQILQHPIIFFIFAFTDNPRVIRKLSLIWGVRAYHAEVSKSIDEYIDKSIQALKDMDLVQDDDVVIHVGSTPTNERGRTNILKLSYV